MDVIAADSPVPYRRLTLLDLIGLVIVSGVGVGAWVLDRKCNARLNRVPTGPFPATLYECVVFGSLQVLALAWLVSIQAARRSRQERLQPGCVACFAVLIASAISTVQGIVDYGYHFVGTFPTFLPFWETVVYYYVGIAVLPGPIVVGLLVGWLVLFWGGFWRKSTSTMELFGRWVGVWFIVIFGVRIVIKVIENVEQIRQFPYKS